MTPFLVPSDTAVYSGRSFRVTSASIDSHSGVRVMAVMPDRGVVSKCGPKPLSTSFARCHERLARDLSEPAVLRYCAMAVLAAMGVSVDRPSS